MEAIYKGQRVKLRCCIRLLDGLPIEGDSVQTLEVIAGLQGDSQLTTSIASALLGMRDQGKRQIKIPPEGAFGKIDIKRVIKVDTKNLDDFPIGKVVTIPTQDAYRESSLTGTVVENDGDFAHVDTNHPLAGETLLVDIHVTNVN